MSVYPAVKELLELGSNERLLEVRRSLRSVLSNFAVFAVAVGVLYALIYFAGDRQGHIWIPFIGELSVRWFAILPALVLVEIVRKYHDDLYIITLGRTTHYEGRLSLTSKVPSVKHEDIRSIVVNQDIVARIFNYGDVLISSAAQSGVELTMSGVRAPRELADILDNLRNICIERKKSEGIEASSATAGGE